MYIKFKTVTLAGFQSIGKATVELSNQGVVLIKGNNQYESYANSNGSGKSSIFESIFWAIYGRTSSGITDPTNRYTNNGCMVKLVFSIDNQEYTIIRSVKHKIYKTGLKLFKGSEDITARNKTDTEKIIKSDVIPFSQDIFLSTVFLSQGFSSRLSALQPSGRKERIEVLTDTASQIDSFRDKIMSLKGDYSSRYDSINRDISYKQGTYDNIESQVDSLLYEIAEAEKDIPESLRDVTVDEISDSLSNIESMRKNIDEEISSLRSDLLSCDSKIRRSEQDISSWKLEVSRLKSDILSISEGKKCPTCGQKITQDDSDTMIDSYYNKVSDYLSKIKTESEILEADRTRKDNISGQIDILESKRDKFSDKMNSLRNMLTELSRKRDTSKDKDKLKEYKASMVDIKTCIDELSEQLSKYEIKRDVAHHCTSLVAKQFRGYLLKGIIDFMNSRLYDYSKMLFSNDSDVVNLVVDSSKLDIYLKDALYDTLSGGERRKVDLALVLTQRDLALNIAGSSCNLLILDETMEHMDESATTSTLDLLGNIASELDSMFIISHNNYSIAYDSIITVTKNKDRISTISISG